MSKTLFPQLEPQPGPGYFLGVRVRTPQELENVRRETEAITAIASFNLDGYINQFYREKAKLREDTKPDRGRVKVAEPALDRKVSGLEKRLAASRFKRMSYDSNRALQEIALKQAAAMSSMMELDTWLKQVISGPGAPSVDVEPMIAAMLGVFHVKFAVFAAEAAGLSKGLVDAVAQQVVMRRFGAPANVGNQNRDAAVASAMIGRLDASNRAIGSMARQIGDLDSKIGMLRSGQ